MRRLFSGGKKISCVTVRQCQRAEKVLGFYSFGALTEDNDRDFATEHGTGESWLRDARIVRLIRFSTCWQICHFYATQNENLQACGWPRTRRTRAVDIFGSLSY
jgi:hypothetical protein